MKLISVGSDPFLSLINIAPAMASATPSPNPGRAVADASQTLFQPIPSSQRPLRREGAIILLSPAEQAMEDAMLRSTPTPEPVLGKRTRRVDDPPDGSDTEPDNESPSTAQSESLPSISNVAAATLRYAAKKKLRPEQRDEVDAFLLVSTSLTYLLYLRLNIVQDTTLGRQAKLFACILSLENKVDAFQSAAPPYQVSDELKVCVTFLSPLTAKQFYNRPTSLTMA